MLREIKKLIQMLDTELKPWVPSHCPPWKTSTALQPMDLSGSIRDGSVWSESILAKGVILQLK